LQPAPRLTLKWEWRQHEVREVRLSDEFAEGAIAVDLGHSPIHDLLANMAYGREVHSTLQGALRFIEKSDLEIPFGSSRRTLKFLLWMDAQATFSQEWYYGQIYWRYLSALSVLLDLADSDDRPVLASIMTVATEILALGALCREYELSDQHKDAVSARRNQLRGFYSHEALAQRAEARKERQAEAERWRSVAREVAGASRLRGKGLANEVRRELRRRGIEKLPSDRSIRDAVNCGGRRP
jgi:hypothetical protein